MLVESPEGILLQTGPLMLTLFLEHIMTKYSHYDLTTSYGLLILPPQVFHAVPNKAKVIDLVNCLPHFATTTTTEEQNRIESSEEQRMLRYAYPSKVDIYQGLDQLITNRDSYELILKRDNWIHTHTHAYHHHQSSSSSLDWGSYSQLKDIFVHGGESTPTIAIHWWQRSWQ
jgi:hypothetical protein